MKTVEMITLTDKEFATITNLVREIQKEERRQPRRKNRIVNLCNKISLSMWKAEQRSREYPSLFSDNKQ